MKWRHGGTPFGAGLLLGVGAASYRFWISVAIAFLLGAAFAWACGRFASGSRWLSRRIPERPPNGWHACENPQCRAPIPSTSRAHYCSEPCRRYARMRVRAAELDEVPF